MIKTDKRNSFLITLCACILFLLTLCYFGVNTSFKGTSAASTCSNEVSYNGTKYCCASGYDKIVPDSSNNLYCVSSSNSNVVGSSEAGFACLSTVTNLIKIDAISGCTNSGGSTSQDNCIQQDGKWHCECIRSLSACGSKATEIDTTEKHSISFSLNGIHGSLNFNSIEVACGDAYGTLPTPSADSNYIFDGWYTSPTGGTKITSTSKFTYCASQTLYAHWNTQSSKVHVSFDLNGVNGSLNFSSIEVTCGDTYGTLPTPSADSSYIFDGWYTSPTGGTNITSTSKFTYCASQTLYAHWSDANYKCYYCSDTQSYVWTGSPGSLCSYSSTYTNETSCKKANYKCYYCSDTQSYVWTGAPGSLCSYSSTYTNETSCERANNKNENPGTENPGTENPGTENPGTEPDPGNPGTDGDNGNGSITIEEKTFTATFDANDGTLDGNKSVSCTTTGSSCIIDDLPKANRNGYTFEGWGTSKTCSSGNTGSITLNEDKTYYACWFDKSTTNGSEPSENPPTGKTTLIAVIWFFGLMAVGYAFYYFKSVREN